MSGRLVFVNNSRETFTPTHSGAIATCIRAVALQAAADGVPSVIITRRHPSVTENMPWNDLVQLPAIRAERTQVGAASRRVRRRVTGWARPDQWTYAQEVESILRKERPTAVIVSNDPEVAAHLRSRIPGTHVVHWFHNLELSSDRFRRKFAADRLLTSMAVSTYLARAVEHAYALTPGRVEVNHNGVDTAEFAVGDRPDRVPVLGFLGRVAVEKGADVLLDAALILDDRGYRFAVQVVGDTNWGARQSNPYVDGVEKRIAALRSRGVVVETLGHLAHAALPSALAGSDIHVFPSRWDEPFGLALLEGMASGQACIASATGGAPEVLAGSGILFVREDATALADSLGILLSDASMRSRLGRQARRRAEELSWENTWQRLRTLVERGST